MRVMFFDLPLRPYQFGLTYEVRDSLNRKVLVFQVQSGDIQYKKYLAELTKIVAESLNVYFKMPLNGSETGKISKETPLANVSTIKPLESKKEAIPVDLEAYEDEMPKEDKFPEELMKAKRGRGRPRKK